MSTKVCPRCGEEKPVSTGFYVHGVARVRVSSWCRACHVAATTARTRSRRATPEGVEAHRAWSRDYQRRVKLTAYGVRAEDADALIEESTDGRCHVCGAPPGEVRGAGSTRRLHIDHDHTTGLYRGLLCKPCNTALGLVEDDVERLMALAAYLLQSQNLMELMR